MSSLGWPSYVAWPMKMATTKVTKRRQVQSMPDETDPLKGQGHVTVNKPTLSLESISLPTRAIAFCTDFGGWGESTIKLLIKIHQYLCNRTTYECFVCFSTNLVPLKSSN